MKLKSKIFICNLKKINFKKSWHLWVLLGLCLIILISHTLYVINTHQYPEQDEHAYLGLAVSFYDILKKPSLDSFAQILKVNQYREPLYGLILSIPLLLFGTANTYKMALWFNLIFYVTTIIAIYFLAKEFLSKNASLLGAFIFSFYGFTLFYLHFTYSETATTTFVVLALVFLAKSKNFLDVKQTFLFSLFFALGILTRWVEPFFVGGAVLFSLVITTLTQFNKKKRSLKLFFTNLAIFILVGIILPFLLYYLPNLSHISYYFTSQYKNAPGWIIASFPVQFSDLRNTFSMHSIMFYFNILSQQTVFFWALFLVGFLIGIFHFRKYGFLIAAFVVAYASFTFCSVLKFDRYIVPIYPMMAIISAITFDHIKAFRFSKIIIVLTVIIGFLNFLGASWGIGPMGQQGLKDIVLPSFIKHPRRIYLTPIVWPPRKEELNANLAINIIENDFSHKAKLPVILFTFQYHPYDNALYTIAVYEKRFKFSFLPIRNMTDYESLFGSINKSDYLLVKDKKQIEAYYMIKDLQPYQATRVMRAFNNAYEQNDGKLPLPFIIMKKIPLPFDKTNIFLYKKTGKISIDQWYNFVKFLTTSNPDSKAEIEKAFNTFLVTLKTNL